MIPSAKIVKANAAGDRAQRVGRLGRGLNVGDAVSVQRRRRRQHDEQRDDIREPHADERIDLHARHLHGRLLGRAMSGFAAGSSFSSSTSSAACQKKRYGLIVVPNTATTTVR